MHATPSLDDPALTEHLTGFPVQTTHGVIYPFVGVGRFWQQPTQALNKDARRHDQAPVSQEKKPGEDPSRN